MAELKNESVESLNKSLLELIATLESTSKKSTAATQDRIDAKFEELEIDEKRLKLEQELADIRNDSITSLETRIALHQKEIDRLALKIAREKEMNEAGEAQDHAIDDLNGKMEKQKKLMEGLTDELQEQKKIQEQIKQEQQDSLDIGKRFGNLNGLLEKRFGGLVSKLSKQAELIKGNTKNQEMFVKGVMEGAKGFSLLTTGLVISAETFAILATAAGALFREFDNVRASFAAATGAGSQFNDLIRTVGLSSLEAGVNLEIAGQSIAGLFTELSAFTLLTASTQKELADVSAQLTILGVSAETSGQNIQFAMKSMGLSAIQAGQLQEDIALFANELGVAPARMAQQFNAARPVLALFGKDATKVFKDLSITAKATGIEINSLINIAKGLDTFESAAKSAANLNAIFGGNLINSVELLTASYEDKVLMLRNVVQSSGIAYNEMNRFEKQMIMAAAGINDAAEAAKLFGTTDAEFAKVAARQKEVAAQQATLNELTQASQTLQQQFKNLLVALTPDLISLASGISSVVVSITEFVQNNRELFQGIAKTVMVIGGIASAVLGIKALVAVLGLAKVAFGAMWAAALGPIGLVVGGLAAAGGLVYALSNSPGPKPTSGASVIPAFANGVTDFEGGVALVGEKGPELVNLPGGSDVIPLSTPQISAMPSPPSVITNNNTSKLIEKVEKIAMNQGAASQRSPTNVVLNLNRRELARAVVDIFNEKTDLTLT